MTLIEGLRTFLAATTGVTTLTGGTNLFPAEGQQAAASPHIVYHRESEVDDDTLDKGLTKSPTAKIGLTCYGGRWGDGYTTARALADAVLAADGGLGGKPLKSYRGLWGSVVIQSCRCTGDTDIDTPPIDGSGRGGQSVQLEFSIAFIKQ